MNEAAVQLMSSKVIGIPKDYVKYFGISFETTSPSYYPLECCLVNQLAFITGEDVLFKSTLNSDDNFKIKFSQLTSPKAFMSIQNAIDDILFAEEDIIKLNNKIALVEDRNKKVDDMVKKIDDLKEKIKLTFLRTQNLIISSYFDKAFINIANLEELENYRKKLYDIKSYLGFSEGYTFFNDYYVEKMSQLEHKYNILENGGIETAINIQTQTESKFITLFKTIKKFLLGKSSESQKNDI